jgi:hypothetical protein
VHTLRDDRAVIEGQTGAHILVGGTTASNIDVSAKLSAALPTFLLVVVGLAFLLLTFAFRTILVPIKSILGFLLSMAAALGAQVAMFQWGWGQHIFGITPTETISFLPIIMLAIIFGLSSDYEVFVVSRIKEDYTKNGDARRAVRRGTGVSARVVTAAALIMFFIFVAFMFTDDPTIKAIGFSFAAGVFLDAFIVRLTLVPAIMAIIGSRLWYHPKWFARHIPNPTSKASGSSTSSPSQNSRPQAPPSRWDRDPRPPGTSTPSSPSPGAPSRRTSYAWLTSAPPGQPPETITCPGRRPSPSASSPPDPALSDSLSENRVSGRAPGDAASAPPAAPSAPIQPAYRHAGSGPRAASWQGGRPGQQPVRW